MVARCGQECLGGGKGSPPKRGQSSSNDRGTDHNVRENFNITVVYVARALLRSSDSFRAGPISTGSRAPREFEGTDWHSDCTAPFPLCYVNPPLTEIPVLS
jgi:hypothetical protein